MTNNESWKVQKLYYLKTTYGKHVERFKGHTDDRMLFVTIYNMIVHAVETLPEEPDIYVKCAIDVAIKKDKKVLNRILRFFSDEKIGETSSSEIIKCMAKI